jgi:hypothetical protein
MKVFNIKNIKYILYNKKNILQKILKLIKQNKLTKIKINKKVLNLNKKSNIIITYNNSKKFIIKYNEEIKFKLNSSKTFDITNLNKIIIGYINGGHYFINFISEYMKRFKKEIIIKHDNLDECNIIIGSYFGNNSIDKLNIFKIFISAENINNYIIEKNYDLIIGNINNTNNIYNIPYNYFPYYAMSVFEQVKYKNQIKNKVKTKFCAFMYSACHNHREDFYRQLSKYKHVDSLGKCCSNNTCNAYKNYDRQLYTDKMTYQDSAIEQYSNYKFVIAMENKYIDGYITEKFILPIKAGAIPIYWGTSDIKKHFNINTFIYINDFPSYQDCINYIKEVDNNNELYQSYINNINTCLENNKYLNTKLNIFKYPLIIHNN